MVYRFDRPNRRSNRRALGSTLARMHRHPRLEPLEARIVLDAAPSLIGLPSEVTLFGGTSLHLALDGQDADGDALSFSAASTNGNISTLVPQGNQSLRISIVQDTQGGTTTLGDVTIELFEQRAPSTTARIKSLANNDFYDGLIFHRIIEDFMIQGGDPDGTGSGGTGQEFADEFHPDLRHSSRGIVSMANSGPNTNDSQFFITDTATPWLDDKHSVFGFVTEGEDVRDAVNSLPTDDQDRPLSDVIMESVEVFTDIENGVLMLKAPQGYTGSGTITVTVTDATGLSTNYDIQVSVVQPPTADWDAAAAVEMQSGATQVFTLPQYDFQGIQYVVRPYGGPYSHEDLQVSVNSDTGQVTVTAPAHVSGPQWLSAKATAMDGLVTESQFIPIYVTPKAPTVSLMPGSDSGTSDEDSLTRLNNTQGKAIQLAISGVTAEATSLKVFLDGEEISVKEIDTFAQTDGTDTVVVETIPGAAWSDGPHEITAVQIVALSDSYDHDPLASQASDALAVTVDTTAPAFTSGLPTVAYFDETFTHNVQTNDEQQHGVRYSLDQAPHGMTIDANTGAIHWTPSAGQAGTHTVLVAALDDAGNVGRQIFALEAMANPAFAPQFTALGQQNVVEGTSLSVLIEAINPDELAEEDVLFSIIDASLPAGADLQLETVDGQHARLRWNPTEAHGPGTYEIRVRAANSRSSNVTTIKVSVAESNRVPQFSSDVADQVISEGETVAVRFIATDDDLPEQPLRFALIGDVPRGATIDSTTGDFQWTPGEEHGGHQFTFQVRVTDSYGGADEMAMTIAVEEIDLPPAFAPVATLTIFEGETFRLDLDAADPDVPTNTIRYEWDGPVPDGMTLDPATGEILWAVPDDFLGENGVRAEVPLAVRAVEVLPDGSDGASSVLSVQLEVLNELAQLLAGAQQLFPAPLSVASADPDAGSVFDDPLQRFIAHEFSAPRLTVPSPPPPSVNAPAGLLPRGPFSNSIRFSSSASDAPDGLQKLRLLDSEDELRDQRDDRRSGGFDKLRLLDSQEELRSDRDARGDDSTAASPTPALEEMASDRQVERSGRDVVTLDDEAFAAIADLDQADVIIELDAWNTVASQEHGEQEHVPPQADDATEPTTTDDLG